jgi:hypothetical protein
MSQEIFQIVVGTLAILCVVAIIMRRKKKREKL